MAERLSAARFLNDLGGRIEAETIRASCAGDIVPKWLSEVLAVALDEICRERIAGAKAHGRVLHCLMMEQGGSEMLAKKAEAQVGEAYGAAECSAAGRRIRSSLASLAEELKSSASAAAQAVRAASGSEAEAKAAAVAAGYRVTQTRWEQRWRRASREAGKTRGRQARESGQEQQGKVAKRLKVKEEAAMKEEAAVPVTKKVARVTTASKQQVVRTGGGVVVREVSARAPSSTVGTNAVSEEDIMMMKGSIRSWQRAAAGKQNGRRQSGTGALATRSSVGWVGCCLGAHRVHWPLRGGQPSASLSRGQALSGEFTNDMLKVYHQCEECGETNRIAVCQFCRRQKRCSKCEAGWKCRGCAPWADIGPEDEEWEKEREELACAQRKQGAASWDWKCWEGWSCASCGDHARQFCLMCDVPTCLTVGCDEHGSSGDSCGRSLSDALKQETLLCLEAARCITGCVAAVAGLGGATTGKPRVQNKKVVVPFPSLQIWTRPPGRPLSWKSALSRALVDPRTKEPVHRHEHQGDDEHARLRSQMGLDRLVAGQQVALDHEMAMAYLRSVDKKVGESLSAVQRDTLLGTLISHRQPLPTQRAARAHALFVAGRGHPVQGGFFSTQERAVLEEIPRIELLQHFCTPMQASELVGLSGHGAVWRAVPRRAIELCASWTQQMRGRKAGEGINRHTPVARRLLVASIGTSVVDGATDGLIRAMSGTAEVEVVQAAEKDVEKATGWAYMYGPEAQRALAQEEGSWRVREKAQTLDARTETAAADAPFAQWLNVTLDCTAVSHATHLSLTVRHLAVFHLICDLWNIIYPRIAGKPVEEMMEFVELEMVEALLWSCGGWTRRLWNGTLLALPYVWLWQELDPAATFHRPSKRGRVFYLGIRRDLAVAEIDRLGGGWQGWDAWVARGEAMEAEERWGKGEE